MKWVYFYFILFILFIFQKISFSNLYIIKSIDHQYIILISRNFNKIHKKWLSYDVNIYLIMQRGGTGKVLHLRNVVLNLINVQQQYAKIELHYDEKHTNYHETFNKLKKIL